MRKNPGDVLTILVGCIHMTKALWVIFNNPTNVAQLSYIIMY